MARARQAAKERCQSNARGKGNPLSRKAALRSCNKQYGSGVGPQNEEEELVLAMSGGSINRPQLCKFTLAALRKAVNIVRRELRKLKPRQFVKMHAPLIEVREMLTDSDLAHTSRQHSQAALRREDGIRLFREAVDDMKMPAVRKLQGLIKRRIHTPVSRMNRDAVEEHIWALASDLRVGWADAFHQLSRRQTAAERHAYFTETDVPASAVAHKARVGPACRRSVGVKVGAERPPAAAPKKKRPPSAYQLFVKQAMKDNAGPWGGLAPTERIRRAAELWRQHKSH